MKTWIKQHLDKYRKAIDKLDVADIEKFITMIHDAYKNDKQIFVLGNGGSSANASHFAVDLGKGSSDTMERFFDRVNSIAQPKKNKRFRVFSINDNVPWMMAIINDYKQEDVFWRQLSNFAEKGDLVICISVSGTSANVVKAAQWSKDNGLKIASITNYSGGDLINISDLTILVQSSHYAVVEDLSMLILHAGCYQFMEQFDFESKPSYEKIKSILEGKYSD